MQVRNLLILTPAIVFTACATDGGRSIESPGIRATPPRCNVTVHVVRDPPAFEIVIDHEPAHTKRCLNGDFRVITWRVVGAGSVNPEFKSDGIVFSPIRPSTLEGCGYGGSRREYTCKFASTVPTEPMSYKYTINIKTDDGDKKLDPTVVND